MKRLLPYLLALLLFTACNDTEPLSEPKLVIDGWIDSGGTPVVLLSSSAVPTDRGGNVEDMMIRWGKVTISNGDTTVTMIGGPKHDLGFPFFRYYTTDFRGIPGQTYTIRADYGGQIVTATSTMPTAEVQIDRLTLHDDALTVEFYAPRQCPAHVITLVCTDESERYYLSPLSMTVCETPLEHISLPVFRPRALATDPEEYDEHFHPGEKVSVMLAVVSEEAYNFWQTYDGLTSFGNSSFLGNLSSLPGNIAGGYGLWSARAVSRPATLKN